MSRAAKRINLLKPNRDAAREGLRFALEEIYTVVQEWRRSHSDADLSKIRSLCMTMIPHMITLAADTREVKDIVDLIIDFSKDPILNLDAIVALASRFFATFDAEDAAPSQRIDPGHNRESPAQVIERLKRQKGWTMEVLAAKAGLDIKQVYTVKRGNPARTDTIGKLAAALECAPGDLIPIVPTSKRQA